MKLSAESRLLIEVLKRAVNDYVGHYKTDKADTIELQIDAASWLDQPILDYKHPWSFPWLCEALSLDPSRTRSNIEKLKEYLEESGHDSSHRLTRNEIYEMEALYRVFLDPTEVENLLVP